MPRALFRHKPVTILGRGFSYEFAKIAITSSPFADRLRKQLCWSRIERMITSQVPALSHHGASTAAHLSAALEKLTRWVETERFQGWDPFDSLNSPFLKPLGRMTGRFSALPVQVLKRLPWNLRPALRIPKTYNAKAMGLFLASYLRKFVLSGEERDWAQIHWLSNWLMENRCAGFHGPCWGYPFDWPNRSAFIPAGTPNVVTTCFIAKAFLDVHRFLHEGSALEVAAGACRFILNDLYRHEDQTGICFSYTPLDRRRVHNANLLAASVLAEAGVAAGVSDWREVSRAAVRFTLARQRSDGSFPYGEAATEGWVDNFHTGFVIDCLEDVQRVQPEDSIELALCKAVTFYRDKLFLTDGIPKHRVARLYPVNVHSVAQGILTFSRLAVRRQENLRMAERIACWGIKEMQDPQGYFYFEIRNGSKNKIPYMRWGQAWMMRALTELAFTRQAETITKSHVPPN